MIWSISSHFGKYGDNFGAETEAWWSMDFPIGQPSQSIHPNLLFIFHQFYTPRITQMCINKLSIIVYWMISLLLFSAKGHNLSLTCDHSNSKPQPSNQFPMDQIKFRTTFFFLLQEAVSLGYMSKYERKDYSNFHFIPTLNTLCKVVHLWCDLWVKYVFFLRKWTVNSSKMEVNI